MVAEQRQTGHNEKLPKAHSIRLVCWNRELAEARASALERAGFQVNAAELKTSGLAGQFKNDPPNAIVIDLDRLPSHGLAVGAFLRQSKSTRHIPLVFAGGVEEKVARIRERLPDAAYADWKTAPKALKSAIANAPVAPIVPKDHNFYQPTSLARKLGLKANMLCTLVAAPEGFDERLDDLPEGLEFQRKISKDTKLIVWWLHTRAELEHAADVMGARLAESCNVWFVFPKKSGAIEADFSAYDVRAACLAAGLVDFKICAVDADWTGMRFARKRKA